MDNLPEITEVMADKITTMMMQSYDDGMHAVLDVLVGIGIIEQDMYDFIVLKLLENRAIQAERKMSQ